MSKMLGFRPWLFSIRKRRLSFSIPCSNGCLAFERMNICIGILYFVSIRRA